MTSSSATNLFGDELLSAVFANFSQEKQKFKTTESELMEIFYRLLKNPAYRAFASQYPFDSDGPDPKSKALSDAFASLQQSRLVGRLNPDLVVYHISPALTKRYTKFIEPKLDRKKRLVLRLAHAVEKNLGNSQ